MDARHRRIMVLFGALISLTLLAAPARSADFFGIQVGSDGFGVAFGTSDWWVYGQAWNDADWHLDYEGALAGYGTWMAVDGLGRCWLPAVAAGWQPYTYGRWVSTPLGWTWVAYEPWGYFPHHYGAWALTRVGWVWVPGYEYHPANVMWVQTSAYIGWYPRGPRGWSHAARGFARGYRQGVRDGYDRGYDDGRGDARYATYVEWRHLGDADLARCAVRRDALFSGPGSPELRLSDHAPDRLEIRRRGGTGVPEAQVSRRTIRVGGRTVTAVRPDGLDSSVRRYAPEASRRILSTQAQRRLAGDRSSARPTPAAAPSPRGYRAPEVGSARRLPAPARPSSHPVSSSSPSGRAEPRTSTSGSRYVPSTPGSQARREIAGSSVHEQRSVTSRQRSAPTASTRRVEPRRSSAAAHQSARQSSARSHDGATSSRRRQADVRRGQESRRGARRR